MNEFSEMKAILNSLKIRTVEVWNQQREQFKAQYSQEAIRRLDSSGFIVEWLKNK